MACAPLSLRLVQADGSFWGVQVARRAEGSPIVQSGAGLAFPCRVRTGDVTLGARAGGRPPLLRPGAVGAPGPGCTSPSKWHKAPLCGRLALALVNAACPEQPAGATGRLDRYAGDAAASRARLFLLEKAQRSPGASPVALARARSAPPDSPGVSGFCSGKVPARSAAPPFQATFGHWDGESSVL